ncbi:MAG: tRNA-dihydrouridine synthase [candidate division Zixibacteria bacterium]|nr:tRNA-dihydrouridine synthase [candidate division Zixibacteria bacterium]
MKIGNLILCGKVILTPLARIVDSSYRLIAKRFAVALVYTEMVSVEGLLRGNTGTL